MTACFIHIPKTGGVSIQDALELQQYRYRRKLVRGTRYQGLVTFGHEILSKLVRKGYVAIDGWFLFAFVRNPYDRAVSLWAHQRREQITELGFYDWCKAFKTLGWLTYSPQARWLDGIEVNFLGRFENLHADFARLCDALHVHRRALPHYNASLHRDWRSYYDHETAAMVRRQYARDWERFGYDPDDYLPD
jgi:hypothetical protein